MTLEKGDYVKVSKFWASVHQELAIEELANPSCGIVINIKPMTKNTPIIEVIWFSGWRLERTPYTRLSYVSTELDKVEPDPMLETEFILALLSNAS
jgi:hypothetical protein